jgi:hypothetical protein
MSKKYSNKELSLSSVLSCSNNTFFKHVLFMNIEPVQTCFSVYNQIFFVDNRQKTEKTKRKAMNAVQYLQTKIQMGEI